MSTNSSDNVVHLNEVIVAMVPFPEYSHLNQLFILAHFIASHNITVHFLCLARWNQDLKLRVQGGLGASNIHFEDLLIPSSPTEKDDAGRDGMPPILMLLKKLREPFHKTCLELSTNAKRLVIIHDSIMKELIRDVHTFLNVKSYMFHTGSAFSKYSGLQQSIPDIVDDDHDKLVEQMHDEFPLLENCSGPYAEAFIRKEHEWKLNSGEMVNTLFISVLSASPPVPMATNSSDNEVIVAMVPFPEYSHLNQLFVLARFVASHNIPVHFLCLADQSKNLKLRTQGGQWDSNVHFHDLLLPSSPAETEDAGDGLPLSVALMLKLGEPIRRACLEISMNAKRLVIIHDTIMRDHMRDVHSLIPNVESYMFHAISAITRYSVLRQSIPDIVDDDHDKMVLQMQDDFPSLESLGGQNLAVFFRMEHEWKLNSGEIMNSCRELEGKYLDLLAHAKEKPLLAVGPLHMLLESHNSSNRTRHECLEFLDKQDVDSVIFVSFGSTTTLSQEQVNELAVGLEQSNYRFIWVLRKGDDEENLKEKDGKIELPEGFEERVEGRGMVVRNWALQLEILGHSSTGGFLSHCGWNSCIESISMGVPLAAWPISYDQPFNSIFVTNLLKIGISVKSWAHREELVTASTIEKAVKTLMGTTEGEEMRQRAVELSKKIKSSVSHGGPARKEMESFISNIIK